MPEGSGWFRIAMFFVFFVAFVIAPQAQQQRPSSQPPTFRTGTRLIVTTVSVKDRNGSPIEGLTAKDFLVTEDGEPQEIANLTQASLAATRSRIFHAQRELRQLALRDPILREVLEGGEP